MRYSKIVLKCFDIFPVINSKFTYTAAYKCYKESLSQKYKKIPSKNAELVLFNV